VVVVVLLEISTPSQSLPPPHRKRKGTADSDISYQGQVFPEGETITSIYRFDSYRLTYRWDFFRNEAVDIGVGLTGRVRSADIALAGDAGYANRTDLRVVPLINFRLDWRITDPFSLVLDGDALRHHLAGQKTFSLPLPGVTPTP